MLGSKENEKWQKKEKTIMTKNDINPQMTKTYKNPLVANDKNIQKPHHGNDQKMFCSDTEPAGKQLIMQDS